MTRDRLRAVLAKRCPVCLRGPMFGGFMAPREFCAVCGHRFIEEAGFFQGAMFVSYGLGVAELLVLAVFSYIFLSPHIGVALALAAAAAVHLALVPQLFEYSRVIWAHVVAVTESESHPLPPPPGDC